MIGTTLGPYQVVAKLGEGGMGEVYRARDTALDRDVALKILPESFATDPGRLMRFEREAKTLAALNHPNISAIYGIEGDGSPAGIGETRPPVRALVMELVEGNDLSERIAGGALPLDEALPIARQIASALEAAHESGIVHRDLKPANIKVRDDGTVKVLDFGLAKALGPDSTSATAGGATTIANSPTTLSPAVTQHGLILGTAAYMAPEQAKGRPVDKRADIWAFGVVLYEMLTGRRLFQAEDVSETLAAVLTRDVSLESMPESLPAGLRALISDCLVRDPKQRLRDMGDVRLMLDRFDRRLDADTSAPAATPVGATRWVWPGLTAIAAGLALALYLTRPMPAAPELVTFELASPNQDSTEVISPDGRSVIYGSFATPTEPGGWWLRPMSSLDATPVPASDNTRSRLGSVRLRPTWAPDGSAVVFVNAQQGLAHVSLETGQTNELVAGGGPILIPGAWNREGTVLYGQRDRGASSIWRVQDTGGRSEQVIAWPGMIGPVAQIPSGFLPDGRRFLYLQMDITPGAGTVGEVFVGSLDLAPADQPTAPLLSADGPAIYSNGHLLYVTQGNLMAHPFDPTTATLTGAPVQLLSGLAPYISVSDNGSLVYRLAGPDDGVISELRRFDRNGQPVGTIGLPATYGNVTTLDDGRRIVVGRTDRGQPEHLFVVDLARGVFTRLNADAAQESGVAVGPAPDYPIASSFLLEGESQAGYPGRDIYVRPASGVGDPKRLVESDHVKHALDWSPDGQFLIYDEHPAGRESDLMLVRVSDPTPIPFLTSNANETYAQFSPDGQWIVYQSNESDQVEIYVRDFAPDSSPAHGVQKVQISAAGGRNARWSRDGREIFFLQGATLMRVPVTPGPPFEAGTAVAIMETRPSASSPYDILPDGGFIINTRVDTPGRSAPPMRVVLNWQGWLKK